MRERGWQVACLSWPDAPAGDESQLCDITDPDQVATAVASIKEALGPPSAVVIAGEIEDPRPVDAIRDADWRRMLAFHLGGAVNVLRATLPDMIRNHRGAVVTMSSSGTLEGGPASAHVQAAQGAMRGLTKSLSVEFGPQNIRVNCVALAASDGGSAVSGGRSPHSSERTAPDPAFGTEEPAEVVRFLLEDATFVTGDVLVVAPSSREAWA
jgi:NAD(P)-dependent dehydrogenase (short-subunit alcohol dehydrogenase family)